MGCVGCGLCGLCGCGLGVCGMGLVCCVCAAVRWCGWAIAWLCSWCVACLLLSGCKVRGGGGWGVGVDGVPRVLVLPYGHSCCWGMMALAVGAPAHPNGTQQQWPASEAEWLTGAQATCCGTLPLCARSAASPCSALRSSISAPSWLAHLCHLQAKGL